MSCDDIYSDVDVVIPTVGRSTLGRALSSALAQTVRCRVFLVVASDAIVDVAIPKGREGDVIVVSGNGPMNGSTARNVGSRLGNSPFIAYLDDDDWWEPDKLERQLHMLETHPYSLMCSTAAMFYADGGSRRRVPKMLPPLERGLAEYLVRRPGLRYGDHFLQASCIVVRRSAFERDPWDTNLRKHQDWDFMVRVLKNDPRKLCWVEEPLCHVEQGTVSSLSKNNDWRASLSWYSTIRASLGRRARAEFVSVHVLRPVLAERDVKGIVELLRRAPLLLCSGWPALVVGLAGLIRR